MYDHIKGSSYSKTCFELSVISSTVDAWFTGLELWEEIMIVPLLEYVPWTSENSKVPGFSKNKHNSVGNILVKLV